MRLLAFKADWCGPCKMVTEVMKDMEFPYEVELINIDENGEKASQYGIRGIPTLLLLDDEGKTIATHVGMANKADLEAKFLNV